MPKVSSEVGFQKASLGQYGLRVLTSAAISVSGENFIALQAMEESVVNADIVLDTASADNPYGLDFAGDTSIALLTIPAGVTIYGRFTDVDVDSGKVIGYLI